MEETSDKEAPEEEGKSHGIFRESIAGIRDVFRSGSDNVSAYMRARTELLRIETEEAAATGKLLGILHGAGFSLVIVGYVLLLLTAIFFFTQSLSFSAQIATGIAGLLHFVTGVILLSKAGRRAREARWFHESREQWKQDQQWLEKALRKSSHEKHN